jgi:hypothetical protein
MKRADPTRWSASRRALALAWAAAVALGVGAAAHAAAGQIFPLDDSLTVVTGPSLRLQFDADRLGPKAGLTARGSTVVLLSLNTAAYVGKRVRISQSLAPSQTPFQVSWEGGKTLRGGSSRPGQRVLVFEGLMNVPRVEDQIRYAIVVDGGQLNVTNQLQFSYDIEVL